jgi:hypothetical protein
MRSWELDAVGVLRTLVAGVAGAATTVAIVGIAVGVPLAIAAGQVIWRGFAINIGVVAVPVVRNWLIGSLAAGVLAAANATAQSLRWPPRDRARDKCSELNDRMPRSSA